MSSAKITLIGLYRWLNAENIDLFDAFKSLPEGIDKETLVNLILTEGGEFEPLYADANMMKGQIELFVSQHMRTFTKWVKALAIEYNPLENYDRMEDWTDVNHNIESSTGNIKNNSNGNSSSNSTGNNTDNTNNTVSAFDDNSMSPHDSSITSSNSSVNSSANSSASSSSNSITNGSSDGNSTHTGRTHGNIGVTTSQQMLQSELDIARFNIYQHICDLFIDELLLAVYI